MVYYEKADKKLYFTEPDIREFIRCKAAAHTMVATLLEYCGLGLDDIDRIYLAGGFGTHIDLESAVTVGIYPDVDRKKMVLLGNTSLAGAKKLLLDAGQMARVRHFLESSEYLHFSEMERFPENMVAAEFIPHTVVSIPVSNGIRCKNSLENSIFPLYRRKAFGYNALIYAIYEK